ncbi:MAG: 1,4-dihydroxy-2-naphthoate octaprenyltransferase [Proteobacteria bacterium]|nr:1,4-dihydroxy-2-naphthoate octaprenyltransferase [Pseudomonadota bacterium]
MAVGTALAGAEVALDWRIGLTCALAALLLQVGANLANDALDFAAGVDGPGRLGPPRATQSGWLSYRQVLGGAAAAFAAATLCGIQLAAAGGWPIVAVGCVCMLAALAYSGGPFPLSSHGLGELTAFAFFGPVAVAGSAYLHTGTFQPAYALAACPIGFWAACIMLVNNLRDAGNDARAGKRTLVVRLGEPAARRLFALLLGAAYVWPLALVPSGHARGLLVWLSVPWAWKLWRGLRTAESGADHNRALAGTARLLIPFAALYALGIAW